MKRLLLRFMLVFLAVLTISYAAAPFDSSDGGHEKTERSRTRNLTSPKIQSLHTEGLARYIGVSNSYFKENRTKRLIQLKVLSGGIMMLIKMII